jgi:hypothetical protein
MVASIGVSATSWRAKVAPRPPPHVRSFLIRNVESGTRGWPVAAVQQMQGGGRIHECPQEEGGAAGGLKWKRGRDLTPIWKCGSAEGTADRPIQYHRARR